MYLAVWPKSLRLLLFYTSVRGERKRGSINSKLSIMVIPNCFGFAHINIVSLNSYVKTSWQILMVDICFLFLFLRSDLYFFKIAKGRLVLLNITSHWKIQRSTRSNTRCAIFFSLYSLHSSFAILFIFIFFGAIM